MYAVSITVLGTLEAVAVLAATAVAMLKWLRVAQREHYLAGSVSRFARRWWTSSSANVLLLLLAIATWLVGAIGTRALLVLLVPIEILGPVGLSVRGRTSKLAWTRRLQSTAAVAVVIDLVLMSICLAGSWPAGAWLVMLLQAVVVDVALAVAAPVEKRVMATYVADATKKLRAVHPVTVAITGSYGKTTTKGYLRHLLSGTRSVVASPASFNNTGGLSRTMNEHLSAGTEVLIAEMGMYGPGEIRALCDWVQPCVAAIVNIGPVHLERVGSLDGIVAAKSEIFERAQHCVLNIDAHGLAALADRLERDGKNVTRFSTTDRLADVAVIGDAEGFDVYIGGDHLVRCSSDQHQAANVAGAVALALALDIGAPVIATRLGDLPATEHRQQVIVGASGATVIDNTFSSNPASASSSLDRLDALARHHKGKRIVVTPGMVELGVAQRSENEAFGRRIAGECTHLIIVGQTNRAALQRGTTEGDAQITLVTNRDEAVAWVKEHAGPGDVVLYEGDLPDHYP